MTTKSKKEYIKNLSISLIDRMKETSAFSDVDLTIITYLFHHLDSISDLTVSSLAQDTYSSAGSIVRFTKKLRI